MSSGAIGEHEVYEALRSKVLGVAAADLEISAEDPGSVLGLVVDVPAGDNGFATVVALADGTVSMYLSTGGGTIGAGTHDAVAVACRAALRQLNECLSSDWSADATLAHPTRDTVKFFVITNHEVRSIGVPVNAFWGREPHALLPLIAKVQDLISAIRGIRGDP